MANLVAIDGSLHRPPMVTFSWGALTFQGVVTDVKQTYTMFMPDGMPVRARVELTLKSVTDLAQAKRKRPFESPDRTKYRTVHQGEHLWNFAAPGVRGRGAVAGHRPGQRADEPPGSPAGAGD